MANRRKLRRGDTLMIGDEIAVTVETGSPNVTVLAPDELTVRTIKREAVASGSCEVAPPMAAMVGQGGAA